MSDFQEISIETLVDDFSFIVDFSTVMKASEIKKKINKFSRILRNIGIGSGNTIGLNIEDKIELGLLIMTTLQLGCTVVLFDNQLKSAEYTLLLEHYPIQFLLADDHFFLIQQGPAYKVSQSVSLISLNKENNYWEIIGSTKSSVVLFTSGSTSKVPKAVVKSIASLLADAKHIISQLSMNSGNRILCAAPIYHAYGLSFGLLAPLLSSSSVQYVSPSVLPSQLLKKINDCEIDIFVGLPIHYKMLADYHSNTSEIKHLKIALSATASIDKYILLKFQEKYKLPVSNVYGSSETGVIMIQQDKVSIDEPVSIGLPFPGVNIYYISNEGNLPNVYELSVVSEALAQGYFQDGSYIELKNEEYWKTGDLVTLQNNKYYFAGRLNTFINVNGKKVNPIEVEDILKRHPNVKEAVVIGEKSDKRIEVPHAFLTVNELIDDITLINFCKEYLADYKIPEKFTYIDNIPRSTTGKIIRSQLNK